MQDNLFLWMTPPAGEEPSTLPDLSQEDWGMGCFAHPGSFSDIRTLIKRMTSINVKDSEIRQDLALRKL